MESMTHVLHLATSKETPDTIINVAIKDMFRLIEVCWTSSSFRQLFMVGSDAGIGHFHYRFPVPISIRHTPAATLCLRFSKSYWNNTTFNTT